MTQSSGAPVAEKRCTCGGMDFVSCLCGFTMAEFVAATGRPVR